MQQQPHGMQRAAHGPNASVAYPAPPPALAPGTTLLKRYRIENYIGGGGFAHIYLARDLYFGHLRAIKEAFYRDSETQRQFRLEAEFLLNARHPNLVRGYAVFEQASRLYLVMDYVDGETVEDIAINHIRRHGVALPEAQVLDWMIPICEAAHALHTQPVAIIHRDIKPANIKLSRQTGAPILIDLGLAKLHANGQKTLSAALAFTPGYAPPEQYQASGATDQRTDVYGLGASLFFLLTGYQPTEAPARLSSHALPSLHVLNPLLSALADETVHRAMALVPAERQQSAALLAADVRAARDALGATARSVRGVTGALSSGGQAPLRTCLSCHTPNPGGAHFCMRCGAAVTFGDEPRATPAPILSTDARDAARVPVVPARSPAPEPPKDEAAVDGRTALFPATAESRWTVLPADRRAGTVGYPSTPGFGLPEAQITTGMTLSYAATQTEARSSIVALLALICVAMSLVGAFAPVMRLFVVLGLVCAHWLLGLRLGDRVLWRPAPLPRDFRLLAWVALVCGYVWLAALLAQWALSLVLAR